jgi:hypothetical protein
MKRFIIHCAIVLAWVGCALSGSIHGNLKVHGDLSVEAWTNAPVGSGVATYSQSGAFTNGPVVNYYRLYGTNLTGITDASTNLIVTLGTATNHTAAALTWTGVDGASGYLVELSYDEGVTWTNWLPIAIGTNWTDLGTNVWQVGAAPYASAPAPEVFVPGGVTTNISYWVGALYEWHLAFTNGTLRSVVKEVHEP